MPNGKSFSKSVLEYGNGGDWEEIIYPFYENSSLRRGTHYIKDKQPLKGKIRMPLLPLLIQILRVLAHLMLW